MSSAGTQTYTLVDNHNFNQYEFRIGDYLAKIEYKKDDNRIFLTHTEVPPELGGQGIGTELVKQVLEDIKDRGLRLVPLCPFVIAYIKRHPEWMELVNN